MSGTVFIVCSLFFSKLVYIVNFMSFYEILERFLSAFDQLDVEASLHHTKLIEKILAGPYFFESRISEVVIHNI